MTNTKEKSILASVGLICGLLAMSVGWDDGVVSAKEGAACNAQTLLGTYGNWFQFLNLVATDSVPQPLGFNTHWPGAGISVYDFDGQGQLSGTGAVSFGGQIQQIAVSGAYAVNEDCSGTMAVDITIDGQVTLPGTLNFVVVNNGEEIHTLGSSQGDIAVGTMKKQFPMVK